ncbi:hypothetical protein KR018_003401 [Drosophila ironensis]|nr:hypothetical protein KR018_003401 [Drosophila ironensis]
MYQNRMKVIGFLMASLLVLVTQGANILGVFTSHIPSHLIVHMSLMKPLAQRGHNVTVLSSLPPKETHERIKHILVPLNAEEEQVLSEGMAGMVTKKQTIHSMITAASKTQSILMYKQVDVLEDPRFKELYLNEDNRFDVVFFGYFFNSYQVGLGARFKCPVIVSRCGPAMPMINELLGNPELSSVPQMQVAVAQGQPMNFKQRWQNFVVNIGFTMFNFYLNNKNHQFYDHLWGMDKSMPTFEEAKQNVSLAFFNGHSISEGPIRPNVPAVIEIGGIHVKSSPDPLPQDIAEFLDKAENGAILFSLGSILRGEHIPEKVVRTLYFGLSSLKQKVIWKWEDLENTPGNSANILYKKWLPQDDILAHPNLKLFITHAGRGGVIEAQYHGVPMLALPVFADQPEIADTLVKNGFGLRLELAIVKVHEIKTAIKEILGNPKYAQKLKAFSQLYRDRPMSAQESVIYWTEYVIRHHGAPHMQSPLVKMSTIAAFNLDIYILVGLALYLAFLVNKIFWRFVWRRLIGMFNKTPQAEKIKQQ